MMKRSEDNPNWKGGTWTNSSGYLMVLAHGHPAVNCRNYAPVHRKVFYDYHGWLPEFGWHIHHWDDNKMNNAISNLMPTTETKHGQIHLTPERAREIGRKGGRKTARLRRGAAKHK